MQDVSEQYFEFLIEGNNAVIINKSRVIGVQQIYPDDWEIPDANEDKTRCRVEVSIGENETKTWDSIETIQVLIRRLYERPVSRINKFRW